MKKDICQDCEGEGYVRVMEYVYECEPHMADIGTAPCRCQDRNKQEDQND